MAEKFGGGTHGKETRNDIEEIGGGESTGQNVSDIRKKYEKKLAAYQGNGAEVCVLTIAVMVQTFA